MSTPPVYKIQQSILVVDDDPDIGIALNDLLTSEGFDVEVVDTGNGALTAVKESHEFAAVLLDMGLPDIDGLTVLKNLVEWDSKLPIIVITAFSETEKTVGALEQGAFAYVRKPYNKDELKTTVRRAIAVKDLQGRYLLINQQYESLFDLDREAVKGKTDHDIFPQEIADAFRRNDQLVLEAGTPLQSEEVAPHADGLHYYVSNKFPLRNADGAIYATCGISTDITERKHAEKALQESEERFRQVVELIKEVFWLTNPEKTKILYVSPGYESIWGCSCESLYISPRTWLEAIHSEDRGRVLEAALTKQVSGEYDEKYRIVRPDGSIRWIRDRAFPVKNEAGNVYRIAGIAEDITGQR